ncbi:MAG: alpha/beta hydrolase, partial [Sedimenticolaceae bacterium]
MTGLIRYILRAAGYSTLGASVVLVIVYVLYLNGRADLDVWHTAELDQEFTEGSGIETFGGYLELEERLFRQLDELVYAEVQSDQRSSINRYNRGSLSDPERWRPNWNRSFELPVKSPRAAVLLLHGMSDSPYSLRHLGEGLNAAGAYVLGLRMPGHGTAPSGLVEITWQDMAAAVRLAMRHLAEKGGDRPLYVVGYSAGAALAVQYALASIEDEALPQVDRLVLLSPAIGVTSMAALAVWQARLGHLLGLDKLAWNSILPEYDPFKYNSFAVNAGDVVYQLTNEIQERIGALEQADMLRNLPPILAFSSVVDATVSTPALIEGLFERLPAGGHELVLFDINRTADIDTFIKWDPARVIQAIDLDPDRVFTLSILSNHAEDGGVVSVQTKHPDEDAPSDTNLGISWPQDLYSLSHV